MGEAPHTASGGGFPGGGHLTIVKGVWCQALSLSRLPVLGAGSQAPLTMFADCRRCLRWDPSPAPQQALLQASVARCGGGGRASPGADASRRCEGRLGSGAHPPPAACPLGGWPGSAAHLLGRRMCGHEGPALSIWRACPAGCCAPQGWREAGLGGDLSLL